MECDADLERSGGPAVAVLGAAPPANRVATTGSSDWEGISQTSDSTKGSLGSPPSSTACSFLFFRRPVVVFGGRTYLAFELPPSGVKSKRIFLSADIASILRFNPCGSYLKVVLLFSAGSSGLCLTKRSTPKKSVSCVSVRVVLVMSEPIRLVFIGLLRFVIFVVRKT